MAKRKDPLLVALKKGSSYTWTVPEGGDLASMRAAIKHGQTITMSPVTDSAEVKVGDLVYVQWHQSYLFHMVGEIQSGRFLIVNSLGKVNGWVSGNAILGRVTEIVDPEPRLSLPDMLVQLETAYQELIEQTQPAEDDARRLLSVAEDLRWYAGRIGPERWDRLPVRNKWSFEQLLWRLTRQAREAGSGGATEPFTNYIDRGKECVGQAAEILSLFEPGVAEQ